METTISWKYRIYYTFFIISIFLTVWFYTGDLISLLFPELDGYTRLGVVYGLEILFCIVAVMIMTRKNLVEAIGETGMSASPFKGLLLSIVVTLPLPIFYSFSGSIS